MAKQRLQPADLTALADRLDGLPGEKEELRQLTRQAHEAAADLRDATASMRSAVAEWRQLLDTDIGDKVREAITDQVAAGLDGYKERLAAAVKAGDDRLTKRYDRLIGALFGDDTDRPMEEIMGAFKERITDMELGLAALIREVGPEMGVPIPPGLRR